MQSDLKIGLVGSYGGHPLDILLPIISENEFSSRIETSGHCFYIYNLDYTKLYLFSKSPDGTKRTAQIDIRSSCKAGHSISIYVVRMNDGQYFLRSYIDAACNGLYPMPKQLL